ncbi:GNAT family N-acetyltransferase [Halosimplex aquaticum]|uniref:GNAT family N-acetyltransferase n=1 Tax=Halosimplex aquaticum TaxID=3026162 RepID=A0ABD5XW82_9EURY|nr:GNAT family N-acetyltransferase [Halosimplex aquaticum]
MTGLWRLTRNRYGRTVYDGLAAVGVTATWMREYVADPKSVPSPDPPSGVSVGEVDPSRVAALDAPVGELVDGERVVATTDGDEAVGYLFCSTDATHRIHPLERRLSFDGAYIRRVFVAPEHRQRGVASALVRAACQWARERDADRATALVALDNRPSRALFEKHGFVAERAHRYVRLGPLSTRSVAEIE